MNSFMTWLQQEDLLTVKPKLRLMPAKAKLLETFTVAEMRAIIGYKPRGFVEVRLWTLINTLIDTGCRIDELLTCPNRNVDLDNLLVLVTGKGSKQRKVPFSHDLRKVLFRYQALKEKKGIRSEYLFCSREGSPLMYRNVYRDIIGFCGRLGVESKANPHAFRHFFACNYIRNGGSIYALSRILGHTSVKTTEIYLRALGVDDIREMHAQYSPLAHL